MNNDDNTTSSCSVFSRWPWKHFFFLGRRRESRNVVAFFLFFSQFLIFKYQLLILKIGCLNHQWNREDCSETARKRPLKCPDMKAFPTWTR